MADPNETVHQWDEWLKAQPWDYFATFTTPYPITLKSARRLMTRLADRVCLNRTERLFWVAERFELREGYHLHALMRTGASSAGIFTYWRERYRGRVQVRKYNPALGAAGYVSKYVTKAVADYDVEVGKKNHPPSLFT